jgi:hypothetical protein
MQRSPLFFARLSTIVSAIALAALCGCATATDDGPPSGATHDAGVHGADTRAADFGGAADDTTTTTGASFDGGGGDDSSSTPFDAGSPVDDAGPSDAPSDPTCAASASNNDCQMCCYTAHTDAYNAFADALSSCACKPGNCDTTCAATACASPPASADATCIACLKSVQTGVCKSDIDAVCGKPSGACYPFARCVITSGCNTKP